MSSIWRIKTIAGLVSIHLHLHKIRSQQQLRTMSLPSNHTINLLLEKRHSKNSMLYYLFLKKLMSKQQLKVKSSIVDTNNCLNKIFPSFNSLYKELSSGFKLVDNFPDYFSFHIVNCKDKNIKKAHFHKLDKNFKDIPSNFKTIIVISNASINAILISHICLDHNTIAKTIYYAVNIISTETELFAIRYGINQVVQVANISHIIVITDAIHLVRQIFDLSFHSYQLQSITIA